MQSTLESTQVELEKKGKEAAAKLEAMVEGQNDAEGKRSESLRLAKELAERKEELSGQRTEVESQLAKVEPALKEAQESVQNIKRVHLDEVRGMGAPPAAVRRTLEAVATLLGAEWKTWQVK